MVSQAGSPQQGSRSGAGAEGAATAIPNKLFFRIGEASRLLGVPAHVLRYWEKEFPGVAPEKSSGGQRLYRRKDLELLLMIKHLLYERKFTIAGARQWLAEGRRRRPSREGRREQGSLFTDRAASLRQIREELAALVEMLK